MPATEPQIAKMPKPPALVPMSQAPLERLLKAYLLAEGIADSRFGRDVMADPNFVKRWREERPKWGNTTRLRLTKFFMEKGYVKNG